MEAFILLQAAGGGSQYSTLILMAGVFVIMYFTMIYPQQKRMKKEKAFRDSLKTGDDVITDGGLFGRIVSIEENFVLLRIDDNVKIKILRASIRGYASQPAT